MNKLPTEILHKIFMSSLPEREAVTDESPLSASISSPLCISHVCRHWREIAISFRELWSYLSLRLVGSIEQTRLQRTVEVFDTWLQRTNGCPLNFAFRCELLTDEAREVAEYCVQTLLSVRSRWKDVRFYWALQASSQFPVRVVNDMPILVSLVLDVSRLFRRDVDFSVSLPVIHVDISKSSNLENLELEGITNVELGIGTTFTSLNSARVVYWVEGESEMLRGTLLCLDVLKASPNMVSFEGDFKDIGYEIPAPAGSVLDRNSYPMLHNMRKLTLIDGSGAGSVLDRLTLPNLVFLKYYDQEYDEHGEILSRFFQRSIPPLRALHLVGNCTEAGLLVPLLRSLPALQELRLLDLGETSPSLFQHFTRGMDVPKEDHDPDSPILCPALRSFHISGIEDFGPDFTLAFIDSLFTMVETRWQKLQSFNKVMVWDTPVVLEVRVADLRNDFDKVKNILANNEWREIWIDGGVKDPLMISGIWGAG